MKGMQDHEFKRLAGDPKKHEQKNNGNFYAGSSSSKTPMKSQDYTTSVSDTKRNTKRGNYAS